MKLWRIAKSAHADLSGEGARLFGGRWNSPGQAMVYLAEHPGMALLEILVHLDLAAPDLPDDYVLMTIHVPEAAARRHKAIRALTGARAAGDRWLADRSSALASVPSFILPEATNWLFNPGHGDAASIRLDSWRPLEIDARLHAP